MFLKELWTTDKKMFRQRSNSSSSLVLMIFFVILGQQVVSSTSSSFKDVSLLFSSIQPIPSSIEAASIVIQGKNQSQDYNTLLLSRVFLVLNLFREKINRYLKK